MSPVSTYTRINCARFSGVHKNEPVGGLITGLSNGGTGGFGFLGSSSPSPADRNLVHVAQLPFAV